MTATTRSASKDLVIASQRLMDGLLDVEESAFRVLDAGVQQVADATRENIVAAERLSRAKLDRADIMVVVGGVIPPGDYPALFEAGAAAVFGPGTVISEAAVDLLEKLIEAHAADS